MSLDERLRREIKGEHETQLQLEKAIRKAQNLLPLKYLFDYSIHESKLRMKHAVLSVSTSLELQGKREGFSRWRQYLKFKATWEARMIRLKKKQSKAINTINAIFVSIENRKPKQYFNHWRKITYQQKVQDRKNAAAAIQRIIRGFIVRTVTLPNRKLDDEKLIRVVFLSSLFLRKKRIQDNFHVKLETIRDFRAKNARVIQGCYRQKVARKIFTILKAQQSRISSVVQIQKICRSYLYKVPSKRIQVYPNLQVRKTAAIRIQRFSRGCQGRHQSIYFKYEFQMRNNAAQKIQKRYRIYKGSYELNRRLEAKRRFNEAQAKALRVQSATKMQSFYRTCLAIAELKALKRKEDRAARLRYLAAQRIQIFWWKKTGQMEMAKRCELRRVIAEIQFNAANDIQKIFRGHASRQKGDRLRNRKLAILRLQCMARCVLALLKLKRLRVARQNKQFRASTVIQCLVRKQISKKIAIEKKSQLASLKIQGLVRMFLAYKLRKFKFLQRQSAIEIQRISRGFQAKLKCKYLNLNRKAIVIQSKLIRPRQHRKKTKLLKNNCRKTGVLMWIITNRNQQAKRIQLKYRGHAAKRILIDLRIEAKTKQAVQLQKHLRMFLAFLSKQEMIHFKAAREIQQFFRRYLNKCVLLNRFVKRAKLLQEQLAGAVKIQALWRRRKCRKRYKTLIQREANRIIKTNYIKERKREENVERRRLQRLEMLFEKRQLLHVEIKSNAKEKSIQNNLAKDIKFKTPGWAKNLPHLDMLEILIDRHTKTEKVKSAWAKINDEHYFNSITNESQWESPFEEPAVVIAEQRNQEIVHRLRCQQHIPWMTQLGYCNADAVIHCIQCNLVYCEYCSTRYHGTSNHFRYEISSLQDQTLCIECEQQLANKMCIPCNDGFCNNCWSKTHSSSGRSKHQYQEIDTRFIKPVLEHGDSWCPICSLVPAVKNCTICTEIFCDSCFNEHHSHGRRVGHYWVPANEIKCWSEMYDIETCKYYYLNSFTGEKTFDKPLVLGGTVKTTIRPIKVVDDDGLLEDIANLQDTLSELQQWKEDKERRRQVELATAEPEKFQKKGFISRLVKNPMGFLLDPKAATRSHEEESHYALKSYLDHMLRDIVDSGASVDTFIHGGELSKQKYTSSIVQEMSQARREMRIEGHQQALEQMSIQEFKRRVQKLDKEFKGYGKSQALSEECAKAGIQYGAKVSGEGKLEKSQAIEALVLHRHNAAIAQKRKLEQDKKIFEETKVMNSKLKQLESAHKIKSEKN